MNRFIIFLAFILIYACSIDGNVDHTSSISGRVNFANSSYVFLEKLTPYGYNKIDSCTLNEERFFTLSVPKVAQDIYRIDFFGRQKVRLVLGGDDVQIIADGNSPNGHFEASGSEEIEVLSEAYKMKVDHKNKMDLLDQKLRTAGSKGDSTVFNQIADSINSTKRSFTDKVKNLISLHDGTLTAFLVMSENLDYETHLDFYKAMFPIFEKSLGEHWFFKYVKEQFQDIEKLAIGSIAPGFTLPDNTGQPISLSSFRGKYLFLDFWASWCQPCRRDNPKYLSIYNEFSNDNFEILGVSFDRKRENWLKAIEKDGLKWAHVSDLQYFDSKMIDLYNITNVPTTFLLDPDGKIIAKNIHPEELEKILFEIL